MVQAGAAPDAGPFCKDRWPRRRVDDQPTRRPHRDLARDTIRYYERLGPLPGAPRSTGRQRRFGNEHEQRLRFIRCARALGFGLEAIGSLLQFAAPGRRSCATVRALALADLAHPRAMRPRLLERFEKHVDAYTGLLQDAGERSNFHFAVVRDDATDVAPSHHDVTAALARDLETQSLQGVDNVPAAEVRQPRHRP
jgi:DNA-binding transcriptional MerR regulator